MKKELFEQTPIPQAVLRLGFPTVAGMVLAVLYNMANLAFVGFVGNQSQLAVMTLLMPVSIIAISIASVFAVGGASCISRQLGTKKQKQASKTCSFCLYAVLLCSFLTSTLGLYFLPFLLKALGGEGFIAPLAKNYGTLLLCGTVPAALSFTMNQLIRASGAAKEAMNGMILGIFTNIAADFFFIIYLRMGVVGSAVASLAADLFAIAYYLRFIRSDDVLSLSLRDASPELTIVKDILAVGFPSLLTYCLIGLSNVFFNRFALSYGDHVVAAFGVATRIITMPSAISLGLAKGAQPLIGYSYASGNLRRMRAAIGFSCGLGTAACLLFSIFLYSQRGSLISIFTGDPDVVWLCMVILGAMTLAVPIAAVESVLLATFQAMGKASIIFFLSVGRHLLISLPLLFLFHHFFGLWGLILLNPVNEYCTTLITAVVYRQVAGIMGKRDLTGT